MSFSIHIDHSQAAPIITLKDASSKTEAQIYAFGALLNEFSIMDGLSKTNVVAGFESVEDAMNNITNGFKSAKLSPFVCRMREGKYVWDEDHFQVKKFFLANHAIHGILYDAVYEIQHSEANMDQAKVELWYQYPGNIPGYPFPFLIQVDWTLTKGNQLSVATSVTNASPSNIPLSDGWHPYFNLGTSVDDCTLRFSSKKQLEFDEDLLPTGKLIDDNRFADGAALQGIFLDNCFELDKSLNQPFCKLSNQHLELTIEPESSYPYLQIYTPPTRDMIAIENLSSAPDAFNNQMGLQTLEPHSTKVFRTTYMIQKK
jgi:aldose 1-epimerase